MAGSAAKADARLVRALGTWTLAASIVNITVGGGIFRLPAYAAASLGPAAPLAYLVCAVAMGLIGRVVPDGAALDSAGRRISGLYAVGRTAASLAAHHYASGISLGDGSFFGRRAGRHAAARAPAEHS